MDNSSTTDSTSSSIQVLSKQYNNVMEQYKDSYTNYITAVQNSESTQVINQYKSQMNDLNKKLKNLNTQIQDLISNSMSSYQNNKENTLKQMKILTSNSEELEKEQVKIELILKESDLLNKSHMDNEIAVNSEYYQYVLLLVIVIILIILVFLTSK